MGGRSKDRQGVASTGGEPLKLVVRNTEAQMPRVRGLGPEFLPSVSRDAGGLEPCPRHALLSAEGRGKHQSSQEMQRTFP